MKSTATAYLCALFFGAHYIYFGKIVTQLIFWATLGGFGLWMIYDLITMPSKVNAYNQKFTAQNPNINLTVNISNPKDIHTQ